MVEVGFKSICTHNCLLTSKSLLFILIIWVFACIYFCIPCAPNDSGDQKKVSDPLEMELRVTMSMLGNKPVFLKS